MVEQNFNPSSPSKVIAWTLLQSCPLTLENKQNPPVMLSKVLCKTSSHSQEMRLTSQAAPCDLLILSAAPRKRKATIQQEPLPPCWLSSKQRFPSLASLMRKCLSFALRVNTHRINMWLIGGASLSYHTTCSQEVFPICWFPCSTTYEFVALT